MSKIKKIISYFLHVLSIIFIFIFLLSICCSSDNIKGIVAIGIISISSLILALFCYIGAKKIEDSN